MNDIGTPDQIRLDPFKNLKTKGLPFVAAVQFTYTIYKDMVTCIIFILM